MTMVKFKDYEYSMQGILAQELARIRKAMEKQNTDFRCVIDGAPGVGKSTFAKQMAGAIDPNFAFNHICMSGGHFARRIDRADPFSAIILDEAVLDLMSKDSMSKASKFLEKVFNICRYKRLFLVLCIPSIFDLNRSIRLTHINALFHMRKKTYADGRMVRIFEMYDQRRIKEVCLYGNQDRNYKPWVPRFGACTRPKFFGTFPNVNIFAEEYDKIKEKAVQDFLKESRELDGGKDPFDRDMTYFAVLIMNQYAKLSFRKIRDLLGKKRFIVPTKEREAFTRWLKRNENIGKTWFSEYVADSLVPKLLNQNTKSRKKYTNSEKYAPSIDNSDTSIDNSAPSNKKEGEDAKKQESVC